MLDTRLEKIFSVKPKIGKGFQRLMLHLPSLSPAEIQNNIDRRLPLESSGINNYFI